MRQGQFRTHLAKRRCVIPTPVSMGGTRRTTSSPIVFHAKTNGRCCWPASAGLGIKGDKRIGFAILIDAERARCSLSRPHALGARGRPRYSSNARESGTELPIRLIIEPLTASDGSFALAVAQCMDRARRVSARRRVLRRGKRLGREFYPPRLGQKPSSPAQRDDCRRDRTA
jgi:hypothetical protein